MPILAQQYPVFKPAMRIITAITNANPAVVTTSFDHNYIDGIILRLDIPKGFGMMQADQLFGSIEVLTSDTFSIDIDTSLFDAFVIPAGNTQYAQAVPIAELNDMLAAAVKNVLPY